MVIIMNQKYIFQLTSILTLKFVTITAKIAENDINSFDSFNFNNNLKSTTNLKSSNISPVYKNNFTHDNDNNNVINLIRTKKDLSENKQKNDSLENSSFNVTEQTITEIIINDTNKLTNINETIASSNSVIHPKITTPKHYTNTSERLVPTISITPVYENNATESDKTITVITIAVITNGSNDSYESIASQFTSKMLLSTEKYTETTETHFNTSINLSLTQSTTESVIKTTLSTKTSDYESVNDDKKFIEGLLPCDLQPSIKCIDKGLIKCFGIGYIDCGSYRKRSINDEDYTIDNIDDSVFKLSLEKNSQSDSIINKKCVISGYVDCNRDAEQMKKLCSGRGNCVPIQPTDQNQMQWWKIGLIAALSAAGATVFIIVAVIAYISWNKLKVRPEMPMNGYQNSVQHNTRV